MSSDEESVELVQVSSDDDAELGDFVLEQPRTNLDPPPSSEKSTTKKQKCCSGNVKGPPPKKINHQKRYHQKHPWK